MDVGSDSAKQIARWLNIRHGLVNLESHLRDRCVRSQRVTPGKIRNSELLIFEGCAHAPIYENVAEFSARTLQFLTRHSAAIPVEREAANVSAPPTQSLAECGDGRNLHVFLGSAGVWQEK